MPSIRSSHYRLAPVLALTALPSGFLRSEPLPRSQLLARIDSLVAEAMARDRVAGASIGVHHDGDTIFSRGYGYADLENEVRATEHTVYRIGSVTKQFTAAAVLLLAERGELSLDDPITRFLPDYPTRGHRITVDRLLNHTSGIKGYTEMPTFWDRARLDLTHQELIDLFASEPFEFPPGQKYQYNNSAYYLLGLIIEKVSGQSYADFLRRNFWEPLGMVETHYLDNDPIIRNRAEGYEVRDGSVVNDQPLSMKLPYAAGGLGSTVFDLLKWQRALVTHRVLSAESYARMIAPGKLENDEPITYGYGLQVGNLSGHRKVSHAGGINGFRAQLSYYPDDDLTVVVLCNTGAASPAPLESRIAREVLGLPHPEIHEVPISAADLALYAGVYDSGRVPITVSIREGSLSMQGKRLRPVGNHVFYPADDDDQKVTFSVEKGRAVALRMEREGQTTEGRRVP
jgi:CubicO group peptidase (beta-lactamase class C family)